MKLNLLKKISIITLLMPSFAFGLGSVTATLNISTNVIPVCTVSAQPIAFGSYDGLNNIDATSTFTVTCQNGATATATFDGGKNASAITRKMAGASSATTLDYALYSDATRTIPIPMSTTAGYTITADGTAHNYDVYARIPSGQAVLADTYSDIVTLTIAY